MSEPHVDYFQSKEHEELCMQYISEEAELLHDIVMNDGPLPAMSRCVAILSVYPVLMGRLGLKNAAVSILKDALKEARKRRD